MIDFTNIYEFIGTVVNTSFPFYSGVCDVENSIASIIIPVADSYDPEVDDTIRVYNDTVDQDYVVTSYSQFEDQWHIEVTGTLPINGTYNYDVKKNGIKVGYIYGHLKEIQKQLIEMAKSEVSKLDKFPMLMLILDVEEDHTDSINEYVTFNLNIVIADQTDPNYTNPERLENKFNPVLWPIYDAFMWELTRNAYLFEGENIPHTKFDRFYWSTEGAADQNVLAAYLDAVEIQNLKLTIKKSMIKC